MFGVASRKEDGWRKEGAPERHGDKGKRKKKKNWQHCSIATVDEE